MEFLIYFFAYVLTILFIFFPNLFTGKTVFFIWYLFSIFLSLIIRSSIGVTESADIDGYIENMQREDIISFSYYFREPIFWFGIRFLYDLIGDGAYVFVFLDLIVFLLIYIAFSKCRKSFYPAIDPSCLNYLLFAALLFFPYVLGMHNTYRQLMATFIFLISIGLIGESKVIKGYAASLVAVLIHNPVAIFFPILVMSMKNIFFKYSSVIILAIILFSFQFLLQIDSAYLDRENTIEIGRNIQYLYMIALALIFMILISFEALTKNKRDFALMSIFFILLITYIFAAFFFTSDQAQRIIFYVFGFLFPFIGFYFELRFKPKILSKLIFFHAALAPLLLIYNTTIDLSL